LSISLPIGGSNWLQFCLHIIIWYAAARRTRSSVLADIFNARYWQPSVALMASLWAAMWSQEALQAMRISGSENSGQYRSCLRLAPTSNFAFERNQSGLFHKTLLLPGYFETKFQHFCENKNRSKTS
jgi:hypothetical protein